MNRGRLLLFLLFCFISLSGISLDGYMFRIYLKDKAITTFCIDKPQEFLSDRAIERRNMYNIQIDSTDLPVSSSYISTLEELGFKTVAKSKWMNTVGVYSKDSITISEVSRLSFVDSIKFVWKGDTVLPQKSRTSLKKYRNIEKPVSDYGFSYDQVRTINGIFLHELGFRGKGLEIAVIDAGYKNLKEILLLDNIVIKGYKDFVYQGGDMFSSSDHGLKVLSVMATNRPGIYVGTAPEAKYWLLRSEDSRSEYPIEEDYWVAAAEFADSVGVNIINTSLDYTQYNHPATGYTHKDLDGKTAFITRGAEKAVQKGIFVEVSAGNEGANTWQRIAIPADAKEVLTVGSMTTDSIVSYFSSRGPTADGRIKPDVVALGSQICVVDSDGDIDRASGTSFAGPVMSGLVACLWQAYPNLSNVQLLDIIRKSAHKYYNPDILFGYGIPDMKKAFEIAEGNISGIESEAGQESFFAIYVIGNGSICVQNKRDANQYRIWVASIDGKIIMNSKLTEIEQVFTLPGIYDKVYIVTIAGNGIQYSKKIKF